MRSFPVFSWPSTTFSLQHTDYPLHYRHFSFLHTYNTYLTNTWKQTQFVSAEDLMKSIFWELCCVWNVITHPTEKQVLPFLSRYGDGGMTDSHISTRCEGCIDWMFASWVIQCLIMDFFKNCFAVVMQAPRPSTLYTPTCSWRVSSHCGLNTIRSRLKGILKYLEAGVQLFGLGMHLWICIMDSLSNFPQECFAKEGPQIRKSSSGAR